MKQFNGCKEYYFRQYAQLGKCHWTMANEVDNDFYWTLARQHTTMKGINYLLIKPDVFISEEFDLDLL